MKTSALLLVLLAGLTATAPAQAEIALPELAQQAPSCCAKHREQFLAELRAAPSCCATHQQNYFRSLQAKWFTKKSLVSSPGLAGTAHSQSGYIDPIAFQNALNAYRARNRRAPVYYNPAYDSVAAENDRLQRNKKRCGHFYTQRIAQNAAMGPKTVSSLLRMWANSKGHNALLLDRSATQFGIHSDGRFSTMVMPSRFLGFPAGHP